MKCPPFRAPCSSCDRGDESRIRLTLHSQQTSGSGPAVVGSRRAARLRNGGTSGSNRLDPIMTQFMLLIVDNFGQRTTQARMPVLLILCFFARRDDSFDLIHMVLVGQTIVFCRLSFSG